MTRSIKTLTTACVTACLTFTASAAMAQYRGPDVSSDFFQQVLPQNPIKSVRWIKENGHDDQKVVMRGRLLNRLSDDRYIFADSTGKIVVEIDRDVFQGRVVTERTDVEIKGILDFDVDKLKGIEVKSIKVIS